MRYYKWIKQVAKDEIPHKKVLNSGCNKALKKIYSELQTAISSIRKLVKEYKRKIGTSRMIERQLEIEQEVRKINEKMKLSIVILITLWSEQLQEELTR